MSKISMVSSEASKFSKIQLCEEYLKNGLFFHLKISHYAGFEKFLKNSSHRWIHSGKNPAFLTPPPIFFNWWSWCISKFVFEKFLTMLDLSRWKSNIVRNFCQAWTKSSLVSMSKISMVSSEASKNSKIQLCEEYLKNGLFFHFKIPHNAGFITFFSTTCRPLLAGLAPPHCVSLHRSKSFTASFRSFGYCSRIWIDVLEMHLEIWLHSFRPIYWSSLLTSEV